MESENFWDLDLYFRGRIILRTGLEKLWDNFVCPGRVVAASLAPHLCLNKDNSLAGLYFIFWDIWLLILMLEILNDCCFSIFRPNVAKSLGWLTPLLESSAPRFVEATTTSHPSALPRKAGTLRGMDLVNLQQQKSQPTKQKKTPKCRPAQSVSNLPKTGPSSVRTTPSLLLVSVS